MTINKDIKQLLKTISVLYVEDDKEIQRQLSLFLKSKVGAFYSAYDGREGLELYRRVNPDIVITDIRMPTMDGVEMAGIIRKTDPNTPIVITTAFNEHEYYLKSIEVGIDEFVLKPINPYLLLDALIKCINNFPCHNTSGGYAVGHKHL